MCVLPVLALLCTVPAWAHAATPSSFSQANEAIGTAFVALHTAEVQDYASTASLVSQLNNASQLVNKAVAENATDPAQAAADLQLAESIAREVSDAAGPASVSGVSDHRLLTYLSIGEAMAIAVSAALLYTLGARVYEWWWTRTYKNYHVRVKTVRRTGDSRQAYPSHPGLSFKRGARRKVAAAALVVIAAVLVIAVIQPVYYPFPNTQHNSEMGLLGPDKKIGGYPSNVSLGQAFVVYGRLSNLEGTSQFYDVLVKLGNQTSVLNETSPSGSPVIAEHYVVLANGETDVFPIDLSVNSTGSHHLIFELWSYQPSSPSAWKFAFTGVFNEIGLNVTANLPRG